MLLRVLFSAVVLTCIYNVTVSGAAPGLGLSLFIIATNLYLFILRNSKSHSVKLGITASLVSSTFAFLFVTRANSIVAVINLVSSIFALGVAGYFFKSEEKFSYSEKIIFFPLIFLGRSLAAIGDVFKIGQESLTGDVKINKIGKSVFRGLLGAIPLVLILLVILTAADPIFNSFVKDLFSNIGTRTLISIVVFIAAILVGFAKIIHSEWQEVMQLPKHKENAVEYSVITASIGLIFAVFIIIQVQYLFNSVGERELAALHISSETYSEYVRKGFFELLVAAGVAGAVLVAVIRYLQDSVETTQTKVVQWVGAVVSLETMIILASAAKRLLLYADAHGLTRARIFGAIFLVWMAVTLGLFIIKLLTKISKKEFFVSLVGVIIISIYAISFINIDRLIAIDFQPTVNKEVDYFYISRLSPDAVDGWEAAISDAERTIVDLESKALITSDDNRKLYYVHYTLEAINDHMQYLASARTWKSKNFGEEFALNRIKNNKDFEKVAFLKDRVRLLEERVSDEAKNSTQIDRATQHPLSE